MEDSWTFLIDILRWFRSSAYVELPECKGSPRRVWYHLVPENVRKRHGTSRLSRKIMDFELQVGVRPYERASLCFKPGFCGLKSFVSWRFFDAIYILVCQQQVFASSCHIFVGVKLLAEDPLFQHVSARKPPVKCPLRQVLDRFHVPNAGPVSFWPRSRWLLCGTLWDVPVDFGQGSPMVSAKHLQPSCGLFWGVVWKLRGTPQ